MHFCMFKCKVSFSDYHYDMVLNPHNIIILLSPLKKCVFESERKKKLLEYNNSKKEGKIKTILLNSFMVKSYFAIEYWYIL